ncbi:MAG: hypothetical protein K6G65_08175 [Lachnospiraceae bacterium]|nr:hypothetical protein [Lachnospiraceae bacterium]
MKIKVWKMMTLVLASICVIGAVKGTKAEAKQDTGQVLEDYVNDHFDNSTCYAIENIGKDKTPVLLIGKEIADEKNHTYVTCDVYACKKGKVKRVYKNYSNEGGRTLYLYEKEKQLYLGAGLSDAAFRLCIDGTTPCEYKLYNGLSKSVYKEGNKVKKSYGVLSGDKYDKMRDTFTYKRVITFREKPILFDKKKSVSYDLDGKGKKEKITFTPKQKSSGLYKKLVISINGKKKYTLTEKYGFYMYSFQRLKLKNKKIFLYLATYGDSEDGSHVVLQYKSGKMKKMIDFDSVANCRWVSDVKVSGNRVISTMQDSDMPGLGYTDFRTSYSYKNKKFVMDNKVHPILRYRNIKNGKEGVFTLKVKKEFTIYQTKECTEAAKTVPVGAKVKATEVYINQKTSAVHVVGSGYDGWYSSKDISYEILFEDVGGVA